MEIAIEREAVPTAEARTLIVELDAPLAAACPPHQRHGLSPAELFRPGLRFFERCGFRRRAAFGHYPTLPPERTAACLFCEKSP